MASKHVPEILAKIDEVHKKKSHDYAQEGNPFSNFERAAVIASWFNDPVDKVFATMIGIKLARKAELLNGKTPNNESLEDTFLDENTYSVLWHTYYLDKKDKELLAVADRAMHPRPSFPSNIVVREDEIPELK